MLVPIQMQRSGIINTPYFVPTVILKILVHWVQTNSSFYLRRDYS